jgi:hypothetical protein
MLSWMLGRLVANMPSGDYAIAANPLASLAELYNDCDCFSLRI